MSVYKTGSPTTNLQPIFPPEPKQADNPGERGVVLPIVLIVITFLYTLLMLFISQIAHAKQTYLLYGEKVVSKYAAESGIAVLQQQLRLGEWQREQISREELIQVDDRQVVIEMVKSHQKVIHVKATAWGKHGVIQTAEAYLDPKTLAIQEWVQ